MRGLLICDGHYRLFKNGKVVRTKPGPGTWVGRVLKPYKRWPSIEPTVKLHFNDYIWQVTITDLLDHYYGG